MVTAGILPFRENSHVRTGNRTRDLMISSQRLWPLDHEAGLAEGVTFLNCIRVMPASNSGCSTDQTFRGFSWLSLPLFFLLKTPDITFVSFDMVFHVWYFYFLHKSRPALGPTRTYIQLVQGSFQGAKRPGCDTDSSPLSSAEAKNEWSYSSASWICQVQLYTDGYDCAINRRFVS